jgi:hypothetical protein
MSNVARSSLMRRTDAVTKRDTVYVMIVAVAVLIAARLLPPEPDGYGTHQRLLMPPCLFRAATHLPCPLCGLTTAFARTGRGDFTGAFEAHLLGPMLYVSTVVIALSCLLALISGARVLQKIVDALYSPMLAYWLAVMLIIAWPINVYLQMMRN